MVALRTEIQDAEANRTLWSEIADDPERLANAHKAGEQAVNLVGFFQGKAVAFNEVLYYFKQQR